MFEIEYGQHGMKTHVKSKTAPLPPDKIRRLSMESPWFHVAAMLPPRASFNASWFIDGNLVSLVEKFFSAGWSAGKRKLGVYINNAPTHNSGMTQNFFEHNPLKRFPCPPYSLDIPPFDSCLFGK
jgi:hypothetical protein